MATKKPNLFAIATSELSQDTIIAWLIEWADESLKNENLALHELGKKFVLALLAKNGIHDVVVQKVNCVRQWKHIDILAKINEKYLIVIEDKTNSYEHGNQLEEYKKLVESEYGPSWEIITIYLKTGLESLYFRKEIEKAGWAYFSRADFLKVLEGQNTKNAIVDDFQSYLQSWTEENESFKPYKNLTNPESTKGLYSYLEKQQLNNNDYQWYYVPNKSGGFCGFLGCFKSYHFKPEKRFFLQIENSCCEENSKPKVNLFIKIWSENGKEGILLEELYSTLEKIKEISKDYGLDVDKPERYRRGEFSSVAIVKDTFIEKENGELDLENLVQKIKLTEQVIKELSDKFNY